MGMSCLIHRRRIESGDKGKPEQAFFCRSGDKTEGLVWRNREKHGPLQSGYLVPWQEVHSIFKIRLFIVLISINALDVAGPGKMEPIYEVD